MPREPVATERAPAAIGPYSQAVRAGGPADGTEIVENPARRSTTSSGSAST